MPVPLSRPWPSPLAPGALVAVVAPAGPLPPERLETGTALLQSWGLRVRPDPAVTHPELAYLAGDDQARADAFTAAWTDPDVAAVWCARGGYGVQRMVDRVDWTAVRAAGRKHLLGYSDITALHARASRELDQVCLHAPILGGAGQLGDLSSVASVQHLLLREPAAGAELATGETLVPGQAVGRLVGGNLSLVSSDVGVEPPPEVPTVALFEDIAEEGYRVDRMLTQLLRSGWFDHVVGVVVGDFTEPPELPDLTPAALRERLSALGVPVAVGAPVGHGPRNLTLPLGAAVRLVCGVGSGNDNAVLQLTERVAEADDPAVNLR